MAKFINEPSHTFNEYLLIPGYSSAECIPANVSLKTPLVKYNKRAGEKPAIEMNIPMISAIMQSVSGDRLAVALATEGGVSFIYGSQTIESEAAMVAAVSDGRYPSFEEAAKEKKNVRVRGLMTIPPFDATREENLAYFQQVRALFVDINEKMFHNELEHLSMGMSGDYEDAIRTGATMVRVGSAIFGARNYNI